MGICPKPRSSQYCWKFTSKVISSFFVIGLVTNPTKTKLISFFCLSNELYKFSHERWKEKDCGIDDITIICVLLK